MKPTLRHIISSWTRVGVGFAAQPLDETPDLEVLLLDTARRIPEDPRLFEMAASWLCVYYELVAKHRLFCLIGDQLERESQPVLGLLLDVVRLEIGTDQFRMAIDACRRRSLPPPHPLYEIMRSPGLSQLSESRASVVSKSWNLWTEPLVPRPNLLFPVSRIFELNPSFHWRQAFSGDLRASIVATLLANPADGQSESHLARRCRASRDAIHRALDRLERYGYIERIPHTKTVELRLTPLCLSPQSSLHLPP